VKDVTAFASNYIGIGLNGETNTIDGSIDYTGIIISRAEYQRLCNKPNDAWNLDRYESADKTVYVKSPRYPAGLHAIGVKLKEISLASRVRGLSFDQWLMCDEFKLFGLCEVDGHNKYRWSQSVEYNNRVFFAIPVPGKTGINIRHPELQAVNYSTVIAAAERDMSENKRWLPEGGFHEK
jgi:hypothetical protein